MHVHKPVLIVYDKGGTVEVYTIENRGYIYIMVHAISVYSAGVPYAARCTSAVKIPLPLATFQF